MTTLGVNAHKKIVLDASRASLHVIVKTLG